MFIIFEGIDGAGKSVQALLLMNALAKEGYHVHLVDKEPRPMKQLKRHLLTAESSFLKPLSSFFLSLSDAAYILEHLIEPKEQEGFLVISHRYIYAVLAAAIVLGQSRELAERVMSFFRKPDIIVLLKTSPQTALARKRDVSLPEAGGPEALERYGTRHAAFIAYQSQITVAYQELLWSTPDLSEIVLQVNGEGNILEVHTRLVEKILVRLHTSLEKQNKERR